MEEVHKDLMKEASLDDPFKTLLDTAVKWAEYVLRHNNSETLSCGLDIAKALANYHYATTEVQ